MNDFISKSSKLGKIKLEFTQNNECEASLFEKQAALSVQLGRDWQVNNAKIS